MGRLPASFGLDKVAVDFDRIDDVVVVTNLGRALTFRYESIVYFSQWHLVSLGQRETNMPDIVEVLLEMFL